MPKFRITTTISKVWIVDDASDADDAKTKMADMKPAAVDDQTKISQFVDAPNPAVSIPVRK